MRVLITGATGFIGRALVPVLRREGHQLIALVRSVERTRSLLGAEVEPLALSAGTHAVREALERSDAVVNLAGEAIMGGRWTEARRRVLVESRVQLTKQLVGAIAEARPRPKTLISGSAVGYYGDRGSEVLHESSPGGTDFLAQLCKDWEEAARLAEDSGLRVMTLRTGVVLGRDGGALAQMLPPFRLGVGGPVGSGRQYMPWIHLDDLVQVIAIALNDVRYQGPVNGAAPEQTTSREFAKTLGRALHRPAALPVPALALKVIFGEAAGVLLSSQRIEPQRLHELGFTYRFPTLDQALADIIQTGDVQIMPFRSSGEFHTPVEQDYLQKRRPTHELRTRTVIDAPLDKVFAFFSRAENLGLFTPAAMRFEIQSGAAAITNGSTIDYRLRVGPMPIRWRTRIAEWEPPHCFIDLQELGPYRCWWHKHTFSAQGSRTVMEDHVYYAPPFGGLGRLANRWFIVPRLRQIFGYRRDVIRLRFGAS
jgi:uncharacterized protein (TIGR01777 family)